MLRIIDARTGEPVTAAPARRGLTRVEAHVPARDATGLRVLLVTDLLVRALELGGTPVLPVLTGDREEAELRADAAALGVRPLEDGRDAGARLGATTVHVVAEGGTAPDGALVAVAPATPAAPADDPLALRAALLARHHRTPVELDAAALAQAGAGLLRRRRAVADWARRPSRPVPEEVRGRLRAAWDDDLDAPGVLRVLDRAAADPGLTDGARFETYAYADRFLGLELTRDIGAPL
ncbi:hypothetical protein [Streptomyces fumanus]|uniref:hypothetical protein n=1 Tax=Streptomyces fumanus TaxID=67302 RepID=UPI0033D36C54